MDEMRERDAKVIAEKEADLLKANEELKDLKKKLDNEPTEDLPSFSNRSNRKRSPSDDGKPAARSSSATRNSSAGLTKKVKLGTIEEDDQEQKATISPSNTKPDEEESKAAAAKSMIPSLNLDSENLRKKTTENLK